MNRCSFCGSIREGEETPHPHQETCPHERTHEILQDSYSDDTLFEAVRNTVPGNSVALRGWGSSYPKFRTVTEISMRLLPPPESGTSGDAVGTETGYWTKQIHAGGSDPTYRIEYDPTAPDLIEWYEVGENDERRIAADFGVYLRMESPDVSYFGATLED